MLVDGSGQVKLTKDGNVLLHEMQVRAEAGGLGVLSLAQLGVCHSLWDARLVHGAS